MRETDSSYVSRRRVLLGSLAVSFGVPLVSGAADVPFVEWLDGVRAEALDKGLSRAIVDQALAGVTFEEKVVELDRKQPEFTVTFSDYLNRRVSEDRIRVGREMMARHGPLLSQIGQRYAVQPRFIVGLWGLETNYGRFTGGHNVVQALATLAYDGRRASYFRKELMNALRILDGGHITIDRMVGSWAGAMGQCQFMPSSFLSRAVDQDGDGRRDIWETLPDVFASTANYLAKAGWRDDLTWGREVRLPPSFDRGRLGLDTKADIRDWGRAGVVQADGQSLPRVSRPISASLIEPKRSDGRVFMVYENFETILRWNRSYYFALSLGHLTDAIDVRNT